MQADNITAIVFCGGSGRRLGGVEKPLVRIDGRPLVSYVIERLRTQVASILISCGQSTEAYEEFELPVVPDRSPGEGPLGGLASALDQVSSEWIFTCPCDTPRMADNLVDLLTADAETTGIAVPHDGHRRQNLFLLMRRDRADSLVDFYERGGRAIHRWLDNNRIRSTDLSSIAESFFNVNTPDDLESLRR